VLLQDRARLAAELRMRQRQRQIGIEESRLVAAIETLPLEPVAVNGWCRSV
jgi:hypothetical protein